MYYITMFYYNLFDVVNKTKNCSHTFIEYPDNFLLDLWIIYGVCQIFKRNTHHTLRGLNQKLTRVSHAASLPVYNIALYYIVYVGISKNEQMYNIELLLWITDNDFYYDAIKTSFVINIYYIYNIKSIKNVRSICHGLPWKVDYP